MRAPGSVLDQSRQLIAVPRLVVEQGQRSSAAPFFASRIALANSIGPATIFWSPEHVNPGESGQLRLRVSAFARATNHGPVRLQPRHERADGIHQALAELVSSFRRAAGLGTKCRLHAVALELRTVAVASAEMPGMLREIRESPAEVGPAPGVGSRQAPFVATRLSRSRSRSRRLAAPPGFNRLHHARFLDAIEAHEGAVLRPAVSH